jgi:NTP pyrophosphatase (non-canonical NTP hydrolase)
MKDDSERIADDTTVINAGTIWVTKYALTRGIIKTNARFCRHGTMAFRVSDDAAFDTYAHGNDWHWTRESAVARAEEMRKAKIASLKKQIASLEKRVFLVTGYDTCQEHDMSAQRWRPEVDAFADAMEAKLRANDHKRHWRFLDMRTLSRLLTHEIEELRLAVERCDPEEVLREAADVANFCMMTADMVKRNPKKANAKIRGGEAVPLD